MGASFDPASFRQPKKSKEKEKKNNVQGYSVNAEWHQLDIMLGTRLAAYEFTKADKFKK